MHPKYHPAAEDELNAAALFYDLSAVGLGEEFLAEINNALERLNRHPESGAPYEDNTRRTLVQRFPFHSCIASSTARS